MRLARAKPTVGRAHVLTWTSCVVALLATGFRGDGTLSAQPPIPAHLDILLATIEEQPPVDPSNVAARNVVLRMRLAGPVPSPCGPGFQAYGFLIDSDQNVTTGRPGPAFADLGVDARISASCNPVTGKFVSPLGPVTVNTAGTVLEIQTTVGILPSVDFDWIAFAQDGTRFTRLPDPGHARWTTFERVLY